MRSLVLLLMMATLRSISAQSIIELYPEGIPCANEWTDESEDRPANGRMLTKVHTPRLHHYAPVKRMASGSALMIIPGGGYVVEAWDLEGIDIANRFTSAGMEVFILQHRLPRWETEECKSHVALDDARRGVQTIRMMADSLGIDPAKIAVMGFSAGGHLSGSAAVHPLAADSRSSLLVETYSSRPDASMMIYPVTIMDDSGYGHSGSAVSLLGEDYLSHELRGYYNLPEQVHVDVPPTFLAHASDDKVVPPENALRYYRALVGDNVPASLHIYPTGGHGFGSGKDSAGPVRDWLDRALDWLTSLAFIE